MAYPKVAAGQIIPGTAGQVLTTSSGVATWATPASGGGGGGGAINFRTWSQHLTDAVEGMAVIRDAPYIAISDGGSPAAWEYWLPNVGRVYIPDLSGYSWNNQGSATITDVGGVQQLYAPASGTVNIRSYTQSTPATPYTIDLWATVAYQQANYGNCGIIHRTNSTAASTVFQYTIQGPPNGSLIINKYTNNTTFSASYSSFNPTGFYGKIGMRVTDNGTNRIYYMLYGGTAIQLLSVSRTDFHTPDQVGIYVNSQNSQPVYMYVESLRVY